MKDSKITAEQVLFPLSLLAFVVVLFVAFQTSQIFRERDNLRQALAAQNTPLEEANRVQAQFSALAVGTKKLADQGDKDAVILVDRMKKIGVVFDNPPPPAGSAAAEAMPAPPKP